MVYVTYLKFKQKKAQFSPKCVLFYQNLIVTCSLKISNYIYNCMSVSPVTQSCLTLCNPVDCSMPCFPVHDQLSEPAQTHVHRLGDAIQPSRPLSSPSLLPSIFPASGSFPMSQFFILGGQSIGVLASASVLPANIQD